MHNRHGIFFFSNYACIISTYRDKIYKMKFWNSKCLKYRERNKIMCIKVNKWCTSGMDSFFSFIHHLFTQWKQLHKIKLWNSRSLKYRWRRSLCAVEIDKWRTSGIESFFALYSNNLHIWKKLLKMKLWWLKISKIQSKEKA